MAGHALLSPSSASRWLLCPASVAYTKDMPEETSEYAEEGSRAHHWAERYARAVFDPLAAGLNEEPDTEEMDKGAALYAHEIERVLKGFKSPPDFWATEVTLDIGDITGEKGAQGTADCVFLCGDHLYVFDYKYGKGVQVEAEGNCQLAIYALAAMDMLAPFADINTVTMTIVQPRLGHVVSWTPTMGQMAAFRKQVAARGSKALELIGADEKVLIENMNPKDETCKFCRARHSCPKIAEQSRNAVVEAFPDLTVEQKDALKNVLVVPDKPANLVKAYEALPAIDMWVKGVRESMLARLNKGEDIPGYKLVKGKPGNRTWKDESAADAMLKGMRLKDAERYNYKLVSPTTVEKLVKEGRLSERQWKRVMEQIVRPDGKPTVAAANDPRPAINVSVENDFEKLGA